MTRTHGGTWSALLCGLTLVTAGCFSIQAPDGTTIDDGPDAGDVDDDDDNVIADAGPRTDARPQAGQPILLTQTTSQLVELGVSVACIDDDDLHYDNRYYRVFDLGAEGDVPGELDVTSVEFGVEYANAGNSASQPVEIRLHTLTGALNTANMQQVAQTTHQVLDTVGTIEAVDIAATFAAGSKLVVELRTPDGRANNYRFYIGANNDGESSPGYLSAQECELNQPVATGTVSQEPVHMLINVRGTAR